MSTLKRPAPARSTEDDAIGVALVGLGVGLLVYSVAPPELRAAIVGAIRRQLGQRPERKPLDLAGKYPNAIEVK